MQKQSLLRNAEAFYRLPAAWLLRLAHPAVVQNNMPLCNMQEQNLLRNAVAFYRLLAAWLLRLAYPAVAQNNMPLIPLPEPAPIEFRSLPVHFCLN